MPRPETKPQAWRQSASAGYEQRDVNAKWIFSIVAFLLVAGLIMHFCLAGFMQRLARKPSAQDTFAGVRRAPAGVQENKAVPHLQIAPAEDLKDFRAKEEAELNTYGWIDRTSGIVRVPIERAMELVLQRGLPVRTGSNGDQIGPSSYELQQQRLPAATPQKQPPK
jgi:hypothetical protein